MVRFKVIPNFTSSCMPGYDTAANLDGMVREILRTPVGKSLVRIKFGARYVFPKNDPCDWPFMTYLTGTTETGEDISLGFCDFGDCLYGQVFFER